MHHTKWTELKLISGKLSARRRDWADVQDVIRALGLPRDFAEQLDAVCSCFIYLVVGRAVSGHR